MPFQCRVQIDTLFYSVLGSYFLVVVPKVLRLWVFWDIVTDQTAGMHKNDSDRKGLIKIYPSKFLVIPNVVLE